MADGGHLENLFFASSPEQKGQLIIPPTPLGQLTRNLVGSIGVTCRSKIAKIIPIEKSMATSLKIYFWLLLLNQKAN